MSTGGEKTVVRTRAAPSALRLFQWPLRDEPLRSGMVIGLLVAVSACSGILSGRWWTAAAVLVLLNLTVGRLWIPIEFEFGSKGVIYTWLGRRRRIAWSDIARFELHPDGVVLHADAHPQPFSSLRSLFVRWNGKRDELTALLEYYLAPETVSANLSTQSYQKSS